MTGVVSVKMQRLSEEPPYDHGVLILAPPTGSPERYDLGSDLPTKSNIAVSFVNLLSSQHSGSQIADRISILLWIPEIMSLQPQHLVEPARSLCVLKLVVELATTVGVGEAGLDIELSLRCLLVANTVAEITFSQLGHSGCVWKLISATKNDLLVCWAGCF